MGRKEKKALTNVGRRVVDRDVRLVRSVRDVLERTSSGVQEVGGRSVVENGRSVQKGDLIRPSRDGKNLS